jgi:hypothetical protein
MIRFHVKFDAGREPSWGSDALPAKSILSPTFHVRVESGAVMVGTGGWFPAAETVIVTGELVVDAPWLSVTLSTALYVPAAVYVNDGFATVESPNVPSPFRSHEYEIVSPTSGSADADPSKFTVNGAVPEVGVPVATAVGGWFVPPPDGMYVA